jgi:hypothetical protein
MFLNSFIRFKDSRDRLLTLTTSFLLQYCCLSDLDCAAVSPATNPRYKLYRPESDPTSLGLLVAEALPNCGPFHIHSPCGTVRAEFVGGHSISVSAAMLEQARNFHSYVCDHVLQVVGTFLLTQRHHTNACAATQLC